MTWEPKNKLDDEDVDVSDDDDKDRDDDKGKQTLFFLKEVLFPRLNLMTCTGKVLLENLETQWHANAGCGLPRIKGKKA